MPGFGFVNPLSGPTRAVEHAPAPPIRQAYDGWSARQSPTAMSGWIWYQHWWTENLRSTVEASGIWNGINTNLTYRVQLQQELTMPHANLIWSPVAFVDLGVEYAWGHRVTVANFKGDAYGLQGTMRVRF